MRAILLKNHWTETAGLAYLVGKYGVQGIEVYGSVTLDTPVGGVNPQAVRYMVDVFGNRGRVGVHRADGDPGVLADGREVHLEVDGDAPVLARGAAVDVGRSRLGNVGHPEVVAHRAPIQTHHAEAPPIGIAGVPHLSIAGKMGREPGGLRPRRNCCDDTRHH